MINILKLRQLEKEKKSKESFNSGKNDTEPILETQPVEKIAELENSAAAAGVSIPKISQEDDKKLDIPISVEPDPLLVEQDNAVEMTSEPVAAIEEIVQQEIQNEIQNVEIDPEEEFRRRLIEEVLNDSTMVSRADVQKELEEEQKASQNSEKNEPVIAMPLENNPAVNDTIVPVTIVTDNKVSAQSDPKPKIEKEKKSEEKIVAPIQEIKDQAISENKHDQKNKKAIDSIIQLVGFTIGKEYYGISIKSIKEINRMTEITKVPRAPQFIEGVINLRGNVIPVINLRTKVGMPKKEYDKETRIIIVELSGKTIGFIVDGVREVLRIPDNLLDPPPALAVGSKADYITSVAKLEDDLVILMDPEKLLTNEEVNKLK
jgi:purine-binding chemotaxis protein CheW